MRRKKRDLPLIEGLQITAIAAEGKSLGKHGDVVVFVPWTVPGDVVDVQVLKKRKRYMEGRVVRFAEYSNLRTEPVCSHFGVCGGCKWQHLPYAQQLEFKRQQVEDQFIRIGKLPDLPEINEVLPSEKTVFYRNKLEFTFSPKRWITHEEVEKGEQLNDPEALGFHIPGFFDKVLDITECWLQPEPSNAIRNFVKRYCVDKDIPFYDPRQHTGIMRNLLVRTSSTGEVMVVIVFGSALTGVIDDVMGAVSEEFPDLTSLMYVVNIKLNDSLTDQQFQLYKGRDHIFEQMEGLQFKIGPKSFYQTNSEQAYRLYSITREMAALKPTDIVYDLYTGTGTIANFVARDCRKVIGVEYVPEAIEDARINSGINGIANTEFFAGDMKDILNEEFLSRHGIPDVVILDPPRAGIHESVAQTILEADPERIVYVSCNPATQARDLALFMEKYSIVGISPVDMFPHTHHVENVVKLVRKGNNGI